MSPSKHKSKKRTTRKIEPLSSSSSGQTSSHSTLMESQSSPPAPHTITPLTKKTDIASPPKILSRSASRQGASPLGKGMSPILFIPTRYPPAPTHSDELMMQSVSSTPNIPTLEDPTLAIARNMVASYSADAGPAVEKPPASSPPARSILMDSTGAVVHSSPRSSCVTGQLQLITKTEYQAAHNLEPIIRCPLLNQGNSCYFNSCMQLLANCPAFVYGMHNTPFTRSRRVLQTIDRRRQPRGATASEQLYESLARLLFEMAYRVPPDGHAISTEEALNSLGIVNPTFEGRAQQDCAEMMCTVLGTLEDEGRVCADLDTLTASFENDQEKMKPPISSLEEFHILMNEEPEPLHASTFSSTSTNGNDNHLYPRVRSTSSLQTGVRSHAKASQSLLQSYRDLCESHHWSALFAFMRAINEDNAGLEELARVRAVTKKPHESKGTPIKVNLNSVFVPPKLIFNEVTNAFTGYTVSETTCHKCTATSRSVHNFQLLLVDIPTTEERVKTGSWKHYGAGRIDYKQHRQQSFTSAANADEDNFWQRSMLRPHTTPQRMRAFEAHEAEELQELSTSTHKASTGAGHQSHQSVKKKSFFGSSISNVFIAIKDKIFSKQIEEHRTLQECLYHHFLPIHFKGQNLYKCESCGCSAEATKTEYLAHLPETLLIHMKRFESGTLFHSKKTDLVVFPGSWKPAQEKESILPQLLEGAPVLDLSEFLHPRLRSTYRSTMDELREQQSSTSADKEHHRRTLSYTSSHNNDGSFNPSNSRQLHPVSTYSLVGVVNHHGSLGGGHYTAFAKKATSSSEDWVLLNDEDIFPVKEEEVTNSEEYILMYRQQSLRAHRDTTQKRIQSLARYTLQVEGKQPCLVPGQLPATLTSHQPNQVYISRLWLHSAAFLDDPGPILNRTCYCSKSDQMKPLPVPGMPNLARDFPELPHMHLVPLEWFYVPIKDQDYEIFYRNHGGNAWVYPDELKQLYTQQEEYRAKLEKLKTTSSHR